MGRWRGHPKPTTARGPLAPFEGAPAAIQPPSDGRPGGGAATIGCRERGLIRRPGANTGHHSGLQPDHRATTPSIKPTNGATTTASRPTPGPSRERRREEGLEENGRYRTKQSSVFSRLGRSQPTAPARSPDRFPDLQQCPTRGMLFGGLRPVPRDHLDPLPGACFNYRRRGHSRAFEGILLQLRQAKDNAP